MEYKFSIKKKPVGGSTVKKKVNNIAAIGRGGSNNALQCNHGAVFGGCKNQALESCATIGGGSNITICNGAGFATIFGGDSNTIQCNSLYSFIGGGDNNLINNNASASPAGYNVIFGGGGHIIKNACHSVILGGSINTITGNCNAILGGSLNVDAGHNCVGLFGCNVTAVIDNAFHANRYVVTNMPDSFASGIVACQLYYCVGIVPPWVGLCFVFIR